MASFIGSKEEFRRYIGPRLRNLVQSLTKNRKAEVGACEHCGATENIESAHVKGRDRNEIIDSVLEEFTANGVITVDLSVFEEKFLEEHHPIERSILILCCRCHRKYDSKTPDSVEYESSRKGSRQQKVISQGSQDQYLPITLEPSDPDLFKQELLISKKAEIEINYSDGRVEQKQWIARRFAVSSNVIRNLRSRPEFRSGNWQARGIQRVHVRVKKYIARQIHTDA